MTTIGIIALLTIIWLIVGIVAAPVVKLMRKTK